MRTVAIKVIENNQYRHKKINKTTTRIPIYTECPKKAEIGAADALSTPDICQFFSHPRNI